MDIGSWEVQFWGHRDPGRGPKFLYQGWQYGLRGSRVRRVIGSGAYSVSVSEVVKDGGWGHKVPVVPVYQGSSQGRRVMGGHR